MWIEVGFWVFILIGALCWLVMMSFIWLIWKDNKSGGDDD
jgi:amino acid permease